MWSCANLDTALGRALGLYSPTTMTTTSGTTDGYPASSRDRLTTCIRRVARPGGAEARGRPAGCCWRKGHRQRMIRLQQDREKMSASLGTSYLESRPRTMRMNLPNPKPPSLGCPLSLTPQVFMTSIQLRTSSSSLRETKSKKLRPMHVVVDIRLSLEQ